MKKSKILGIAIAAAMITSAASMTAFADKFAESADIKKAASVGITGTFCDWGGEDVPMTDDDGDGVYEGTIVIDSVTEGMISESMEDKGPEEGKVSRGFSGVQFKIRTDGTWDNSWGDYEAAYNRTYNSQTNCCVEATVGAPLTIKVKLDTNQVVDQSGVEEEDDRYEAGADDAFNAWVVSYEKVESEAPAEESSETPAEESSETPAEESSEAPAEESKTEESTTPAEESTEDSKTVGTGDTTSAIALVAVVIASLGVAVAMTKKASSKE